jgi:hypothetical protein
MFCPQCGSPIPAGQSQCAKCGASAQIVNPSDIIAEQSIAESKPQITSNIPLTEGETILWHRDSKHGVIHKEVTLEEAVTDKRCLKYDVQNKRIVAQIGIENMPEVVIMNVHRVNDSLGGGIFLTPRMLGLPGLPIGLYGGPRRGNLKISGDVSLMVNGNVVMTFENVNSPQGLRQLIQALKRERMGPMRRMRAAQRMGRPFQRFGGQFGAPDTA